MRYYCFFLDNIKRNKKLKNLNFDKNFKSNSNDKKAFFYKLPTYLTLILLVSSIQNSNSQTFCTDANNEQHSGIQDNFRYELWNQNSQGTACMTLGDGALFSGNWNSILNYLARRGLNYNQTMEHQDIGEFFATYDCNYNPSTASGNSYLSVYGWTIEPLIEFYIIEDWRNWIPSMSNGSTFKGTINKNGSIYDIYENTRTNQPSILGTATFQQYFSIRRDERNTGTIDITTHFNQWESLGMNMGKMHEVSFVVEGYQSNGSFDFNALDIFVINSTLNVEETKPEPKHVSVYSKYNSGTISITLSESILNATIHVYDISGKIIFSKEKTNNQQIKITNLNSGIYFVNINSIDFNNKTKILIH